MNNVSRIATAAASGVTIAIAAGLLAVPAATGQDRSDLEARCSALAGESMPGDVAIKTARIVDAGPLAAGPPGSPAADLPLHCLVEGTVNRRTGAGGKEYGIGFELRLPASWNGRFLLQGGGGLNGTVRPAIGPVASGDTPALARGFAVASHDSGHQGEVFDASFMADQRAALDFAETAVLRTTLTARDLVQRVYGRAPHHSYMTGCSTGGREGMLASQRYPELFDGIVIGAPAMRPGFSNLAIEHAQVALNASEPAGAKLPAAFTAPQLSAIHAEILKQCDARDGRADGMIMDVEGCRSFDPAPLICTADATAGCLSPARAEALRLAIAGPVDASGRPVYVPYPYDTGLTFSGPGLPGFLPVGQPGVFGPASTAREMDVDARVHDILWDAAGRLTDTAYWTNLNTYLGRGSKLMYFHGVSDPWFSAFDTWDYFQRAAETNGEAWDDAARFYMIPGMMHCGGGNAYDSFDLLGPMVDWVESAQAPGPVPATRTDKKPGEVPLCPHPSYAHFDAAAQSFSCRKPAEG